MIASINYIVAIQSRGFMNKQKLFNISEFSKITGLSRQTLIYYDHIDLLKPYKVDDNGYRKYSHNQIWVTSVIWILSDLGVQLKDIKKNIDNISPENSEKILSSQLVLLKNKIKKLNILDEMVELRLEQIKFAKNINKKQPSFSIIEIKNSIPFFVGEQIGCSKDNLKDEQVVSFYHAVEKKGIPLIFALSYLKKKENILNNKVDIVDAFCFRLKDKKYATGFMQKGKYLVTYAFGNYGETDYIYKDIVKYIEENNIKVVGDIFEEYITDEFNHSNPDDYILQISIQIE